MYKVTNLSLLAILAAVVMFICYPTVSQATSNGVPQTGACCLPVQPCDLITDSEQCLVITQDDCQAAGGLYQGDDTTCEPNTCIQVVDIDIKPGSCPNPFNSNSRGVLPIALVGTESFDVNNVDISSLQLVRADGVGGSVFPNEGPPGPHTTIDDAATPFNGELCDCHDEAGDGIDDLSMKFRSQDVVDEGLAQGNPGELITLCVTGNLLDGTTFEACDCIRLDPPDGNDV